MDDDEFDQLTQFIFNQSTPPSDKEDEATEPEDKGEDEMPSQSPDPQPERVVRRRARKACVACHRRKVRCDLLSRGHTCTNCRLDSLTCVVRQRGKRTRRQPAGEVRNTPKSDAGVAARLPRKTDDSTTTHAEKNEISKSATLGVSLAKIDQGNRENAGRNETPEGRPSLPAFCSQVSSNSVGDMMYSYYDFIDAESMSHIPAEDFKFLEYKGCFHLPSRPVLDELVREYFLHVHPMFPLIDERLFWEAYLSQNPKQSQFRIPLFVFRALLFVSCSFATDETIQRLGFQRAVDARTCMYQRAQLLYQFNTSSDFVTLSQGCLILTYYCSEREPLANTLWLRQAIQFANAASVNAYNHNPSISALEKQTHKRLWWCLVLRDRILPLGVRRPIQITHEHFDFSEPRLDESDLQHEFDFSLVYDRATKTELAKILVAQIDLAVGLTDVISLVYPASGYRSFDKFDYSMMRATAPKIEKCKETLDSCYSRFQRSCLSQVPSGKPHSSVTLYSGLTRIYYQSARAALCQFGSFVMQAEDEAVLNGKIKQLGNAMHASVATITETIKEFVQLKMARFLPVSMVAFLALPIILNSLDVKNLSSSNTRTEAKRRQLRLLNTAMDLCRERYSGATAMQNVISQTIKDTRSEQSANSPPRATSTALSHQAPVDDWFEIFISKPLEYLRIAFRIDLSLSKGYYPKTEELPLSLYLGCGYSLSLLSPMPPMDNYEDPNRDKRHRITAPETNSYLDYLHLSET